MNIKKQTITPKSGHNATAVILVIILVFGTTFCRAQYIKKNKQDNSISCCYEYIFSKIKNSHNKPINKFKHMLIDSNYDISINNEHIAIKPKFKDLIRLKSNTDDISHWDDIIDWKESKYSIIHNLNNDVLIGVAPVLGASGLETNFYKYIIINLKTGAFQIVQSLSQDARFICDSKGKAEFYIFDYSTSFLRERDYDNISLKISHYKFDGTRLKLIQSEERLCNCNLKGK